MPQLTKEKKMKRLEPIDVDEDTWYYEEYSHIVVVHQLRGRNQEVINTVQIKLPWKKLLESCERKYL